VRGRLSVIPPDSFGFKLFESSTRHRTDPVVHRLMHTDPDLAVWDVSPNRLTKAEVAAVRKLMAELKPAASE
jgi:hypothetical protein